MTDPERDYGLWGGSTRLQKILLVILGICVLTACAAGVLQTLVIFEVIR